MTKEELSKLRSVEEELPLKQGLKLERNRGSVKNFVG